MQESAFDFNIETGRRDTSLWIESKWKSFHNPAIAADKIGPTNLFVKVLSFLPPTLQHLSTWHTNY